MLKRSVMMLNLGIAALVLVAACAPAAAPSPTAAPAKPAPTTAAAKPAAKAEAEPTQKPAAMPAEKAAVRTEGPSITFKFAHTAPESDLSSAGYKHWAQLVEERTGGRIKFQFFWAGSLLKSQDMFQGVRDGLADFAGPATSYISGQVPDLALFEVPFAFPTDHDLALAFQREVEPVMNEVTTKNLNQRVVWTTPATLPDPVSCRDKFLDSEQAWNGALVRTAGKWQVRTLEVWGAKPVVIPLGEAYTALQRGTADCLLLVYNLLDSFKLYEVVKHITRIDHSINLQAMTANLNAWNKLPPEDQKILLDAGRESQEFVIQQRVEMTPKLIDKFKSQGVKVCTPSQQELARLRKATEPVLEEIAQLQTDLGAKIQQIAREYRGKVNTIGPSEGDMTACPGAS